MKHLILVGILVALSSLLKAQDYSGSAGIRIGPTTGFTYKIMLMEEHAFEGMIGFRDGGIQVTGLSLNHKPIFYNYSTQIFAYFGLGGHVGYAGTYRFTQQNNNTLSREVSYSANIGIDGMLGIEYRFLKLPFTTSIDYKPFIDIFGSQNFNSSFVDFAFTLKYTF